MRTYEEILKDLVYLINQDKDGDYFICQEGNGVVEEAFRKVYGEEKESSSTALG